MLRCPIPMMLAMVSSAAAIIHTLNTSMLFGDMTKDRIWLVRFWNSKPANTDPTYEYAPKTHNAHLLALSEALDDMSSDTLSIGEIDCAEHQLGCEAHGVIYDPVFRGGHEAATRYPAEYVESLKLFNVPGHARANHALGVRVRRLACTPNGTVYLLPGPNQPPVAPDAAAVAATHDAGHMHVFYGVRADDGTARLQWEVLPPTHERVGIFRSRGVPLPEEGEEGGMTGVTSMGGGAQLLMLAPRNASVTWYDPLPGEERLECLAREHFASEYDLERRERARLERVHAELPTSGFPWANAPELEPGFTEVEAWVERQDLQPQPRVYHGM